MSLSVLSPREASIFACLTDTFVAPEPLLPPVRDTDAVVAFDRWLLAAPAPNRLGLRGLLYAAEVAPRLMGLGGRLRSLDTAGRARALERASSHGPRQARALVRALKGIACLSYYGDDGVMGRLGYDPNAVTRRGRELRITEARP